MIRHLINLGLVLTPFVVWNGMDVRAPKEIAGLGIALAIGLTALYNGSLKKFKNYWLLLFVGYFLVCMCLAPHFTEFLLAFREGRAVHVFATATRPMSGFWAFKPFTFALIYLLMTSAIASIQFKLKEVRLIAKVMACCGFLMALYIFIQAVELDQFFRIIRPDEDPQVQHMIKPLLGGFIGQPTVVSPFIAMVIPLAIYLRRYFWAGCMIVAVCLTLSKVAIGAMCISVPIYLVVSKRLSSKIIGSLVIVCILSSAVFLWQRHPTRNWVSWTLKYESSGRSTGWAGMWKDFTTPINGKKFCVTGFGPGAFEYTHSLRHKNFWRQAHNDPGEGVYNFGFAGMGILLMALWYMIKNIFPAILVRDELVWAFSSSLICIFICSLGTFCLQGTITATMWYTIVIIGLFHNETITGGYYAKT